MHIKVKSHQRTKELWPRDYYFSFFLCCSSPLLHCCFQGTLLWSGCMGSGLLLMASLEIVSPPSPIHEEHALCQGILQVTGDGTRYKNGRKYTKRTHHKVWPVPYLCTPENPHHYLHVSPVILLIDRSQWFYKVGVPWSTWQRDLKPWERRQFCIVTQKISCRATNTLNGLWGPNVSLRKRQTAFCVSSSLLSLLGKGPLWWQLSSCVRQHPLEQYWSNKVILDS